MDIAQEHRDFWSSLSDQKKIARLERAVSLLEKIGQRQLDLLREYERNPHKHKEVGFMYFIRTVEATWDNIIFSRALGKNKFRKFNVYPTRVVYENVLRLEHYIKQGREQQKKIVLLEMLRVYKRFYDEYEDFGFEKDYREVIKDFGFAEEDVPGSRVKHQDPFPSVEEMLRKTSLKNMFSYFHYRIMSEIGHSKLVALFMSRDETGVF